MTEKEALEVEKIRAEISKLMAETAKLNKENDYYKFVIASTGTLAIVAVAKLFF